MLFISLGYKKFCDFLWSNLHSKCFSKMEREQYDKCKNKIKRVKEKANELHKKHQLKKMDQGVCWLKCLKVCEI